MRRRRSSPELEFWPGFTDVLSGMLLAMVFVLTLFAITQAGLVHMVGGKDVALRRLEDQIAELRNLLREQEESAAHLQAELLEATRFIDQLSAEKANAVVSLGVSREELGAAEAEVADLVRKLTEYLEQVKDLNARLSGAEELAENRLSSLSDLQLAMNRLRQQLAEMSTKLSAAQTEASDTSLRMSNLLAEMARKDKRIVELERLEKYTSEFLAKMSEVFKDNPNIKVVGDRFVFQSEVLFESGSDELGVAGLRELDKFVGAFRELIPRIPKSLRVNVQVQGHTDSDQVVLTDRFTGNWELSTARALRVVEHMARRGIPERMMSASGFGEHAPRVPGNSAEAKAQNRRIEIRITRR